MENKPKIIQYKITKDTIKRFGLMETRRLITWCNVDKIKAKLLNGGIVDLEFKINKIGDKYVLIDGNHRYEALKKIFEDKKNSDLVFDVLIRQYDNCTQEEEIKLYDAYNLFGKKPAKDDVLQLHNKEITFLKLFSEYHFPCKVTLAKIKNGIRFGTILDALNSTLKSHGKQFTPSVLTKEEIVDFAKSLTYEDFILLKQFFDDFIKSFGYVDSQNIFSKLILFTPLLNIYYTNYQRVGRKNIIERMKKLIGDSRMVTASRATGRQFQQDVRRDMISIMNYNCSVNFVK